jgi:hypothetical protein
MFEHMHSISFRATAHSLTALMLAALRKANYGAVLAYLYCTPCTSDAQVLQVIHGIGI